MTIAYLSSDFTPIAIPPIDFRVPCACTMKYASSCEPANFAHARQATRRGTACGNVDL